jgi:hypothetical protein
MVAGDRGPVLRKHDQADLARPVAQEGALQQQAREQLPQAPATPRRLYQEMPEPEAVVGAAEDVQFAVGHGRTLLGLDELQGFVVRQAPGTNGEGGDGWQRPWREPKCLARVDDPRGDEFRVLRLERLKLGPHPGCDALGGLGGHAWLLPLSVAAGRGHNYRGAAGAPYVTDCER